MSVWLDANAPTVRDNAMRDAALVREVAAQVEGARDIRDALERFAWALDGEGMHVEGVARAARREGDAEAVPPDAALTRAAALQLAAELLREVAAKHGLLLDPIPF